MIEGRFGRIINITSRSVKAPLPHLGLSNGARAGLTGFVGGLARQVAKHNVTINNLLPGAFATARQTDGLRKLAAKANQDYETYAKTQMAAVPANRFGDPDRLPHILFAGPHDTSKYLANVQAQQRKPP